MNIGLRSINIEKILESLRIICVNKVEKVTYCFLRITRDYHIIQIKNMFFSIIWQTLFHFTMTVFIGSELVRKTNKQHEGGNRRISYIT